MKNKDKEKDIIWTAKNTSGCKHKRVEKTKWGWHCLDCWAYIDKSMITK
jgi:hypothetical protein